MRIVTSIADYRPQTIWHRAALLKSQLKRLGLKPGRRRLYGTVVPKSIATALRPMLASIANEWSRQIAQDLATMEWSPQEARQMAHMFFSKRRRPGKIATARNRPKVSKKAAEVAAKTAERELALDQAMFLFDEGLSLEQIWKLLPLPRSKIQARLRETRRMS